MPLPTIVTLIDADPHGRHTERAADHDFEVVSSADVNPPANFLTLDAALEAAKKCSLFEGPRGTLYHGTTYDDE